MLFGYWLLLLAAVTQFPFEFQVPSLPERLVSAIRPTLPTASEVVSNLMLFVPAGVILQQWRWPRNRHTFWRLASVAAGAGCLISMAVESSQLFVPRRDPTIVDVLANTAGTAIGALAAPSVAPVAAWLGAWRSRTPRPVLLALLLVCGGAALQASALLQGEARLSGWDETYPLLAGNERTGDRPWRGRLLRLELTDAASSPAAVQEFASGRLHALPGSRLALYEFSHEAPFRDVSGRLPPLEWTEAPEHTASRGVELRGTPWLETKDPAAALVRRVSATNAFSLRVRCASGGVDQQGPARIISNSVDINHRNLMIGQQNAALVIRLRTPHAGNNGSRPEIVVPGVFATREPRDILISFDGATVLVAVAGAPQVHRFPTAPGAILASRLTSLDIESDEHQKAEWVYLGGLFAIPGLMISMLAAPLRARMVIGAGSVLAFAAGYEIVLASVAGRASSWRDAAIAAVIGFAVVTPLLFAAGTASASGTAAIRRVAG